MDPALRSRHLAGDDAGAPIPHQPYRPDMDRRRFLLTALAGALAAQPAAQAQQAAKVPRIG